MKQSISTIESIILEATTDGMIVTDTEDKIVNHNTAAENILGSPLLGEYFKNILQERYFVNAETVDVKSLDPNVEYRPLLIKEFAIDKTNPASGFVIRVNMSKQSHIFQDKKLKTIYDNGLYAASTFDDIIGDSPALMKAIDKARVYATYDSPILLTGETGTGKDLFTQALHNASKRRLQPIVPVNCSLLPSNLVESELFGYEKGAFTGANKEGKIGYFELANGGTIYLDEISELPIDIQSKLLRVIQEGDVIRVGGSKIIHVDVRVICASNKNLIDLIEMGKFKIDLYYRLNVLNIHLPPLRNRQEDIEKLSYFFIKKFNKRFNKNILKISPNALNIIQELPFYGNIRELSNLIERLIVFSDGSTIDSNLVKTALDDNPFIPHASGKLEISPHNNFSTGQKIKEHEKHLIIEALKENNGCKIAAARSLGISKSTLWRRLKEYDI